MLETIPKIITQADRLFEGRFVRGPPLFRRGLALASPFPREEGGGRREEGGGSASSKA